MDQSVASTLSEYLNSQDELVREAALALPHQFSQCTYSLGPLRQAVYLCTTCPEARGLCSACSVACHTDHEQIELFPKRNFRCDCPTVSIEHNCTLHPKREEANTQNQYGHNFDWFHESCCNLREKPSSRENSPHIQQDEPITDQSTGNETGEDAASEVSSSGLPPPLISGDEYESFICGACVSRNPTLVRWAGTYGAMMVVRDSPAEPWRRLNGSRQETEELIQIEGPQMASKLGIKRPLSPSAVDRPEAKRAKASSDEQISSSTACLAPPQELLAQKVLSSLDSADAESFLGAGDLFLTLGFKERWCQCDLCFEPLKRDPYLLQDEETYEPPDDPDSGLSLEELGMRALARLPRDKAIDGIHAFNEMRNDLVKFLRPFAQDDKVVNESDVRDFFASLTEAAKKGRE
ncbi:hypothetical protein GALMADRAFT_1222886 [Galerina marginata CBS 339.88]|uniref:UBR-type domain-containing protein n=1 Tax=Galerina marginata (strain CBS 339.88) TaxID=685588 RepID=A0A067TGS1_GALM3|nr:hypothetical protein GALMADRAFT_1222886 [Galerina marginata CBS 339.88]